MAGFHRRQSERYSRITLHPVAAPDIPPPGLPGIRLALPATRRRVAPPRFSPLGQAAERTHGA